MPSESLGERLEALHQTWHSPRFLATDPLLLVHQAASPDQEVVAFIVSCLALGRASLIVKAAQNLLSRIGSPVAERLKQAPIGAWDEPLHGFVYRFFPAARVAALLDTLGELLRCHGSLEAAWASTGQRGWAALGSFAALFRAGRRDLGVLVPTEGTKGAAKRLNLFLRWMVRRDDLDLGRWTSLKPSELFMPIDTHVLQWATAERLTRRNAADARACWEITEALRSVSPLDPLRFDFSITRAGMSAKNTLF